MTEAERELLKAIARSLMLRCPNCGGAGEWVMNDFGQEKVIHRIVCHPCVTLREAIERVG